MSEKNEHPKTYQPVGGWLWDTETSLKLQKHLVKALVIRRVCWGITVAIAFEQTTNSNVCKNAIQKSRKTTERYFWLLLETDRATNTSYSKKILHTLLSKRSLDSIHHELSAQKSLATFIRPTDLIFLSYFPHSQDRVAPNNFNRPSGHITERMMGKWGFFFYEEYIYYTL